MVRAAPSVAGVVLFAAVVLLGKQLSWVGTCLLQLGVPLLILAQVHWVAQELYLHQQG